VTPLAHPELDAGQVLGAERTTLAAGEVDGLRALFDLQGHPAHGTLGAVHVIFLRAAIATGAVPDGAILTRLTSRQLARLPEDTPLDVTVFVAAKQERRGRTHVTLRFEIAAGRELCATVDQTVIWPETPDA